MAITGSQPAQLYAQAGIMRAGTSRANGHSPLVFVAIAGVQYAAARAVDAQRVLAETLTIQEVDGDTPNTAEFTVKGFQPSDGQDVVITMGSINNLEREFAGTVLTDAHGYIGTPANGQDLVHVIDYTWQLTRETISQRWTNVSATVIAQAILAHAGRGFTSLLVAAGLPIVDEFTVTNQTHAAALSALATRIGASWKATYRSTVAGMRADVRFGIAPDPSQTDPTVLTAASALLTGLSAFSVTRDLSQVITRQPVEGGGGTSLAACAVGETQIPVSELSWYNASGGALVSGPQRLTYTGKTQAAPTTAPSVAGTAGAGIDDGPHTWAYTFVTGSGETLPSLLTPTIVMETLPAAPAISSITSGVQVGGPTAGTTISYAFAVFKDLTQLLTSGITSGISDLGAITTQVAAGNMWYQPNFVATAGLIGRYVGLFRSDAGGGGSTNWYLMGYVTLGVPVGSTAVVIQDDRSHNFNTPFNTTFSAGWSGLGQVNQARLNVVPVGPVGTTQRNIYRTPTGATQLKLQQTIANNTATVGVTDATADASLGANVPTADTSGLVLGAVSATSGATAAGSTTLNLVSGAAFLSAGGWVNVAGLFVRYTGKAANQLTGIPPSGAGSISAAIPSASTVTSLPTLLGIPASGLGSLVYPIGQGDPVNLRVVIDDLPAQAVITALMLPTVDDGVIEGPVMQDGRISETEARARGLAQIALRKMIDVAPTYTTQDLNVHASRTAGVNLPAPTSVTGSFRVRSVSITNYQPALWPIRTVQAGSLYTLESLLRVLRSGGT